MTDVSLSVFQRRIAKRLDPLFDFKWVCKSLPFGHDYSYVEEVGIPFPTINQKEGLFGAGTYTYYPGFEQTNAFDMTLYEDSVLSTTKWLEEWKNKVRNPSSGGYYLPRNFKRNIPVELMNTEGTVVCEITLINCWPIGRAAWDLNYTNNNRLRVQQNFSIDRLEIAF